jgi:hypothetical protein
MNHELVNEYLKVSLFPHQYSSLEAMLDREGNYLVEDHGTVFIRRINILGDMTGMGKTLSVLALVALTDSRYFLPERREDALLSQVHRSKRWIKRFDVYIAPHHLASQVVVETESKTHLRYLAILEKRDFDQELTEETDLVILSSSMASQFLKSFKGCIYRLIIDEADSCALPSREVFDALKFEFIWLVTATYQRLPTARSLFIRQVIDPSLIESCLVKNDDETIKASFLKTFRVNEYRHVCSSSAVIRRVINYASESVAKDLAAGRIQQAMTSMGASSSDNLLDLVRRDLDRSVRFHREMQRELRKKFGPEHPRLLKNEQQLSYYQNRLDSLEADLVELAREPCVICSDPVKYCTVTPCCQHLACSECLLTWLLHCSRPSVGPSCPCCRANITPAQLQFINRELIDKAEVTTDLHVVDGVLEFGGTDQFVVNARIVQSSQTKEGKIISLIRERPKGKFLIYSNLKQAESLAHELGRNGLSAMEVLGNRLHCEFVIDKFKAGDLSCLFLTPGALATGLNLENTTDIIMYEQYSPATVIQIRGRALRLNRDPNLDLNIHTLLHEN